MIKIDERIATLEEKLHQLRVRQQRIEARKRTLASLRDRTAEIRRKILVGVILLAETGQGESEEWALKRWLRQSITRADDRALFEL